MSQESLGRMHLVLEEALLSKYGEIAKTGGKGVTTGTLLVAAVFVCLEVFEKHLPKRKPFKLLGKTVDPCEGESLQCVRRAHLYMGNHKALLPRVLALSIKAGVTVSWIVRKAAELCEESFRKNVEKQKPFKVNGKFLAM